MGKKPDLAFNLAVALALIIHGFMALSFDGYQIHRDTGDWWAAILGDRSLAPRRLLFGNDEPKATLKHLTASTRPTLVLEPPPPPPEEMEDNPFGEHNGKGEAINSLPGDKELQAPEANTVQAFLGNDAYGPDRMSNAPGAGQFNASGGAGGSPEQNASASVANPPHTAPPPPALLSDPIGPSPLASPFGVQPPPAPVPLARRKIESMIARGPQPPATTPDAAAQTPDTPATVVSTAPAEEQFASASATRPAAMPTTAPSDSAMATTEPTQGRSDERVAAHPTTRPFDPARATTHPAELPSQFTANMHFTTQPTTAPLTDAVSIGSATQQTATTNTAVAERDPDAAPATRHIDGTPEGRAAGAGATTAPLVDQQVSDPADHPQVAMANAPSTGDGRAPGAVQNAGGNDPGNASPSESDPFAHALIYADGRVEARDGRKVKTVRPRLTDAEYLDLATIPDPRVQFQLTIDETGKVIDSVIKTSSGSTAVDTACWQATWHWEIEPTRDKHGKPVKDKLQLWIGFN